jgi:endonuclease/exonuclease/phosphatase family metal-dependent hydrolase
VRVLTWNLLHGRSVPGAGRELLAEFASALSGWEWDVALLQEVPPWWPPELAVRAGADARSVLTSRNALLPVRRAIATRWPDLIKSNGGGCNAILVRGKTIAEHRVFRLCAWPERRWLHSVRLGSGTWIGNLHGGGTTREAERARHRALEWAAGAPVVLGGDFNIHALSLPGFVYAGGHDADHVFVVGLRPLGAEVLDHGRLSDHAPVRVGLELPTAGGVGPLYE